MKGYGQFCPVAQTLEIIGERWTLLVVREIIFGSRRFNDIHRGVPQMSRSLLSQRLKSLEDAGVVERRPVGRSHEYELTAAGRELEPIVVQCGIWGQRWARREVRADDLDAGLLMWDLRRNVQIEEVPVDPTVVEFRFRGAKKGMGRFWLVIRNGDVDLCINHPGFDVDLTVRCSLRLMTQIWLGDVPADRAIASGQLDLEGEREQERAFPRWLKLSALAGVERPGAERRIPA
jgi:DNA-binding HxlR family transcriptional regulator